MSYQHQYHFQTTLLLLGLPPKSFVGIDLASFNSTDRFQGIKYIPPGLHFVYFSPQGDMSLRTGFWFKAADAGQHSVIITKYDAASEKLLAQLYGESLTIYRQPAKDGKEGSTRPDAEQWEALSEHIDEALLLRCLGTGLKCSSVSSSKMDRDKEEEKLMELLKGEDVVAEIEWTPVDLKRTWPEGVIGRDRTIMAKDRSWALGDIVGKLGIGDGDGEKQMLGEIQLAFLMAVTLGCYSAMEQWRRLLGLTLTCKTATLGEQKEFFENLMEVLLTQMGYVDETFLAQFVGGGEGEDSWLAKLLRGFGKGLAEISDDNAEQGKGKAKARKSDTFEQYKEIESLVMKKFDWTLDVKDIVRRGMVQTEEGEMVELEMVGLEEDDESGEYAPVIVEEYIEGDSAEVEMTPASWPQ
ncbi:A1 cistron-splicing factor [Morchella snyderi]|nr:A1 cistron-splicing factor [Morchella snyderi]